MNGGPSNWGLLFFSSSGRLPRLPFLVAMAVIIGALLLFENAVPQILQTLTAIVFYAGLLFCSACVLSKRLHDRGRSGWWAALVLLAFGMVWPHPSGVRGLFLLVIIWSVVELGLMPGEEGANRFGLNPQKQNQQTA
jgi:uncharacterized membrane protein YhaH (DUF805 family)